MQMDIASEYITELSRLNQAAYPCLIPPIPIVKNDYKTENGKGIERILIRSKDELSYNCNYPSPS